MNHKAPEMNPDGIGKSEPGISKRLLLPFDIEQFRLGKLSLQVFHLMFLSDALMLNGGHDASAHALDAHSLAAVCQETSVPLRNRP